MITLLKNHCTKGLYLLIAIVGFSFQTQAYDFPGSPTNTLLQSPTKLGFSNTPGTFSSTSALDTRSFFKNTTAHETHFLRQDFSNFRGRALTLNTVGLYSSPKKERFSTRKSPLLAAGMNFFFPGLGYLYTGEQPVLTSLGMMVGAIGLTAVELQLQDQAPDLYPIMFGSVMVLNTSIAIVTFKNTKKNNERLGL